jgi:hypothetical protein
MGQKSTFFRLLVFSETLNQGQLVNGLPSFSEEEVSILKRHSKKISTTPKP